MPRLQFSLKTLLWLMACVACFAAGMVTQRIIMHAKMEQILFEIEARHAGLKSVQPN